MIDIKRHKIRLKITGRCNKSCYFCHKEGDMDNILDFECDDEFKKCLTALKSGIDVSEVIVTGGEPTLNTNFKEICKWFNDNGFQVNVTTNGTIIKDWKAIPVSKVTISIQSLDFEKVLKIETKKRPRQWAKFIVEQNIKNIKELNKANKQVRINMVITDAGILQEINALNQIEGEFEVRLLNNLNDIDGSQKVLRKLIEQTHAKKRYEYRRGASSNHTAYYNSDIGEFSAKVAYPFYFPYICDKCPNKGKCKEGFYGLRIEKRNEGYFVRLCLSRNDSKTLMPYEEFLSTEIKDRYLELQ